MLLAGLDGIQNRMDPGDPLKKPLSIYTRRTRSVASVPDRSAAAIEALASDHSFLLRRRRLQRKTSSPMDRHETKRIHALRLRPHP